MKEYVIKICVRDPEHPLAEEMLLEAGVDSENKKGFLESFVALSDMLKVLGTPEKVAQFIKENSVLGAKHVSVCSHSGS